MVDAGYGYKVGLVFNSFRNTFKFILLRLGLLELVDIYVSNGGLVLTSNGYLWTYIGKLLSEKYSSNSRI